ncbi:hypothetical protein Taro_029281 [Colocasia esculenta]|uniref:Uncharacterized protein n=1 Tax=Colocasia esculenta TaxID=4460 RepID=A0A843VUE1_COLES|nr:hypothetical protein [Colocasia esculenta]
MAAAWENSSDSDSESSSCSDEEEANLAFMANTEEKKPSSPNSIAASVIAGSLGGYGAEFLTPEQQERFTFVKTKVCGNKTVDIADLEKNDMHSVAAALSKMQWLGITTFSEVSYPDLVKAFFVCLRAEADGSLVSSVKGTLIKIDYDLLHRLFRVKTSGHSVVHTVDAQVKGLVPRSATFSTCTKADSNVMFWTIQNKEINMAEVMIERTKFARDQIWDTKKGEAIIEDVPEAQEDVPAASTEPAGAASVANDEPSELVASSELAAAVQAESQPSVAPAEETVEGEATPLPSSSVASILREVLDSIHTTPVITEAHGVSVEEVVASGHIEEEEQSAALGVAVFVDAPIQGEQVRIMEDAPIQGEQETEDFSASQEVHTADAPIHEEQTTAHQDTADRRGKKIAHRRRRTSQKLKLKPILKRLDAQNDLLSSVQSNVSSIIVRQESISNDVSQVKNSLKWFNKEVSSMKATLSEILKAVSSPSSGTQNVSEAILRPSGPVIAEEGSVPVQVQTQQQAGEPGPSDESAGPSLSVEASVQPTVEERPSGQNLEEEPLVAVSMADGVPSEDQGPAVQAKGLSSLEFSAAVGEAQAVVSEPSTLPTPAPPSPPTSSTAPPAPPVLKRPRSRQISSSTPFTSSTTPLPSSTVEVLPRSSLDGASSSGPSSSRPSDPSTITPDSLIHPPAPPSFITLIPEGAHLTQPEIHGIKDEFEEAILKSVLATGTHSHRTGISSPLSKRRRLTSTLPVSSDPFYPPLWFSLAIANKHKPLYEEYLQKVVFAHIFGLPFQNLSNHLSTIFPYTSLSKAQQSKIFSVTEAKIEEQWAQINSALYSQFKRVQAARYAPREAPLPLYEWFQIHHKNLFGPFIQKEIKFIRQYQMFCNYCYVNSLDEPQLGQFCAAISALQSTHCEPLQVDFAILKFPDIVFLPSLHSLIMDSPFGTLVFERAARVMARLTSDEWLKHYPLSAQQLSDLNASQAQANLPPLTPGDFLDANSRHLIRNTFAVWLERFKIFHDLKKELQSHQIFYPIKMDKFLLFAIFGSFSTFKIALVGKQAHESRVKERVNGVRKLSSGEPIFCRSHRLASTRLSPIRLPREQDEASNLVIGTLPILGRAARVLVDSGASLCFAFEEFYESMVHHTPERKSWGTTFMKKFRRDIPLVEMWKFFVVVVLVLRWCHPIRARDVVMVLGSRRRWSFLREGPNGSALLMEVGTLVVWAVRDGSIDGRRLLVGGNPPGRRPKLASTSMDVCMRNNPQKTTELFSFGRPEEEKLKFHHHPQRESTQSTGGSTWSTGDPFIANESPVASASVREIRWRSGNEPSTALFWRSRWDKLLPLWSYYGQVDGRRSCRLYR